MEEVRVDEIIGKVQSAVKHKALWNQKARHAYEIVMDVPRGQDTNTSLDEVGVNYILLNTDLKAKTMLYTYSGLTFELEPNSPETVGWLVRIKDDAVDDMEWVIKDRIITGLGVLGIGQDERLDNLVWYRVSPLHFYWDYEAGLPYSDWFARKFRVGNLVLTEYWDSEWHIIWDEGGTVRRQERNRLGVVPLVPIVGFNVPEIAYPKGDVELTYPQQLLLREVRRTLLDHARRGAGLMLIEGESIPDEELWKLSEPGEQWIRVNNLQGVMPVPTPPINAEWLQVEAQARSDLEAQSGITEYLRGSTPIIGKAKFASEVLATVGMQNLRVNVEWLPIERGIVRAAEITYRWAYNSPLIEPRYTPFPPNDISIGVGNIQNPISLPQIELVPPMPR